MNNFLKQKRGSATVEAAAMLPIFVSVILGFLFFLGTIKESMVLQQAAREGAIYYARYDNPYAAIEKVEAELKRGGIDPQEVTISCVANENQKGMVVQKEIKVFTGIFENITLQKKIILSQLY